MIVGSNTTKVTGGWGGSFFFSFFFFNVIIKYGIEQQIITYYLLFKVNRNISKGCHSVLKVFCLSSQAHDSTALH